MPVDQAASLLAMHCLVHGRMPDDYMVMVAAGENLLDGVASRARQLLEAGWAIPSPLRLSRREQEVLSGVLQNLANKEIAAKLCLSERTVKFHVSSLLAKFHVRGRVGLMQEAANALLPWGLSGAVLPVEFPAYKRGEWFSEPQERGLDAGSRTGDRVVRLPGRRLSA
jgi:DNA-binding CsgD family transcriptional regulator